MILNEIVSGQRQRWRLLQKLGEGDAGEVFLVESLLERKAAILKRPHPSTFANDVFRQASQIRTEGKILQALKRIPKSSTGIDIQTPVLLDQSLNGTEFRDQVFIVIEKAAGFDLKTLARAAHFGAIEQAGTAENLDVKERIFYERLVERGKIPALILLRALIGILELFEQAHFNEFTQDGINHSGLIWNDVKPEHIYWSPIIAGLTIIDWGNGQFLEADGGTADRHFSRIDDYYQFIQELGKFVAEEDPQLYKRLDWPVDIYPGNAYSEGVKPLRDRVFSLVTDELEALRKARRREQDLAVVRKPEMAHLQKLEDLQLRILDYGEIPDYQAALRLHTQLAGALSLDHSVEEFKQTCEKAKKLPGTSREKWDLLVGIADRAAECDECKRERFFQALAAGVNDDWPVVLWELMAMIGSDVIPAWWDDLSQRVRHMQLDADPDSLTPYFTVSRLFYTLQVSVFRMGEWKGDIIPGQAMQNDTRSTKPLTYDSLVRTMEEEVVKKWKEPEPDPPNSGIEYKDIDGLVDGIEAVLPGSRDNLDKVLIQARAQAKIVMDAWHRKDFDTARKGLRWMLLWDPHRRRILLADQAIQAAPRWLVKVRSGARSDESFPDYLTQVELAGRELRNQVGNARWLDLILEAFKLLRNGARPADMIMAHPELLNEIPWLNEYRSRETLSLPRTKSLSVERDQAPAESRQMLRGVKEGTIGEKADLYLADPLDTWVPEARGSSARVFEGSLRNSAGQAVNLAVKVMRPDKAEYSIPLFREEAHILTLLRDVSGVTRLLECGFIKLDEGHQIPADDRRTPAKGLRGSITRFSLEDVQNFLVSLDTRVGQGWLPYLALEKRDQANNLMAYCDAGYTRGRFLPLRESLLLAIQICDILQIAHDRNIVYRDHKILHFYWDTASHAVTTIDWNIAKRYPEGISTTERQFDLVQFSARALHHILTGRPAPGALPLGPNRPEEIEQAAHNYRVQWTYDDERLPVRVKEILEKALGEGYTYVKDLRQDLFQVFQQLNETSQAPSA